jgi:hypothetical protein
MGVNFIMPQACIAFIKKLSMGVVIRSKAGHTWSLRIKWPRQLHSGAISLALAALMQYAPGAKQRLHLFKIWDLSQSGVVTLAELRHGLVWLHLSQTHATPCGVCIDLIALGSPQVALSSDLHELRPCVVNMHAHSACLALMRRLATNEAGHVDQLTAELFSCALERSAEFGQSKHGVPVDNRTRSTGIRILAANRILPSPEKLKGAYR